jgi:hypothetical protein
MPVARTNNLSKKSVPAKTNCDPTQLATSVSRVRNGNPFYPFRVPSPEILVFETANQLRAAFDETHEWIRQSAKEANRKNADVIVALARMQSILSERGQEHRKLMGEAGIGHWTWTGYFQWFKEEFRYDLTLRTVQRKIAELTGKSCPECHSSNGHVRSCSHYRHMPPTRLSELRSTLGSIAGAAKRLDEARRDGGDVEQAMGELLERIFTAELYVPFKSVASIRRSGSQPFARLAQRLAEYVVNEELSEARRVATELLSIVRARPEKAIDSQITQAA